MIRSAFAARYGLTQTALRHIRAADTFPDERVIIAAQLTMGKSMDFLMANLRKALLGPFGGAGTSISVMISSGSRTVVLATSTWKSLSTFKRRFDVTTLAFRAMRAG